MNHKVVFRTLRSYACRAASWFFLMKWRHLKTPMTHKPEGILSDNKKPAILIEMCTGF